MDLTEPAKSRTVLQIVMDRYKDPVTRLCIQVLGCTVKYGTNLNVHHGNIDQFNSGTSKESNTENAAEKINMAEQLT